MLSRRQCSLAVFLLGCAALTSAVQRSLAERDQPRLKQNLSDQEVGDNWIYDDVDRAVALAKKNAQPVFVVFR